MKSSAILSCLGLLASTAFTAPSHQGAKDTFYLHEQRPTDLAPISLGTITSGDLNDGIYTITSPALDNGFVVGRGLEDLSLLPKRIKTVNLKDPRTQVQVIRSLDHYNRRDIS